MSTALIIVGVLVIGYPMLTEVYGYFIQYRLNQAWEKEIARQRAAGASAETEQIARVGEKAVETEETVLAEALSPLAKGKVGDFPTTKIKIPRIDLDQVVLPGVDPEVLKSGPGYYPGTAKPGQKGNVGIAGHRVTYTHPFNRLDELKSGDKIILETLDAVYEYRVVFSKVLDPTDLSALLPTKDARVTLTTCTPKYSAKQRLDVQASLAKVSARRKPTIIRKMVGRITEPRERTLPDNILQVAKEQAQAALAQEPNNLQARISLGIIYRSLGRTEDALGQLEKAVALDPNLPDTHYQLALARYQSGPREQALKELESITKRFPEFEAAHYRLGQWYLDAGEKDKAVAVFKRALVINPLSADTRYYLGVTYERLGQLEAAKREYETALKFIPDFYEARSALKRLSESADRER